MWPLMFRGERLVLVPPWSLLEDAVDVLGHLLIGRSIYRRQIHAVSIMEVDHTIQAQARGLAL